MSGINMLGSFSGIDSSAIEQLMQVERLPIVNLSKQKTTITEQQNAWKDVRTRLNSLFEKIKALQSSETFNSKATTSTNDKMVTLNAGNAAKAATYNISIERLASASKYVGNRVEVDSINSALNNTGTLNIENNDGISLSIEITEEDSLNSIVGKINEGTETTGIKAMIIDNRLVIEDSVNGSRDINISGTNLSDIGLESGDFSSGSTALFNLNGIQIERNTNTVSDAIEGVSIQLRNTHTNGESDTISIETDIAKTEEAVKAFVDQYNSTMLFIEDRMKVGEPGAPNSRGILAGDSALKRLHSSLRQMVVSPITNGNSTHGDISTLGVSTVDRFGQLKFDPSVLKKAMEEDIESVKNFFSTTIGENKVGFVEKLNTHIDSFISTTRGLIKGKNDSFDRSLKNINKQIENFQRRVAKKEEYYIRMFSALDVAMMQAENQMSWLSGQIDAMNAQAGARK